MSRRNSTQTPSTQTPPAITGENEAHSKAPIENNIEVKTQPEKTPTVDKQPNEKKPTVQKEYKSVIMTVNVKHNDILYTEGNEVSLSDEDEKLFKQNGWIA